eukprot:Tbor_TRINITY_DN297_c0_g1::TRINITY_DN297_c0_g1_i1::g.12200::m.12200
MTKNQLDAASPAFVPHQQFGYNQHHHNHHQSQRGYHHYHHQHPQQSNISDVHHRQGHRGLPIEAKADPCAILVFDGNATERRKEARLIANKLGYVLISDENYVESECPFVELRNAIVSAKAGGHVNGFVIEGFLLVHHTEIHYLINILEQNQVLFKGAIYIDDAEYKYCTEDVVSWQRTSYPINYEVCKIHFVGDKEESGNFLYQNEFDLAECYSFFKNAQSLKTISLSVTATNGLKILSDKYLFNDIKKQVHALLLPPEILDRKWSFPVWTPCKEMDYNHFTRYAHDLKSYFVTYDLEGERCLLVKFRKNYYLYMSNCASAQIIDEEILKYFITQLDKWDSIMKEALKMRNSDFFEAAEVRRKKNPDIDCVFEVTTLETNDGVNNFAVADMLYFYGALGSEMVFEERRHIVKNVCDSVGSFITLKWYNLDQMAEIASKQNSKFKYGGLIFAHPGTYYASFCKKGFVYKYFDSATADVRIWNGKDEEQWEFNGYATATTIDQPEVAIKYVVYCKKDLAESQNINYGHIVRIRRRSAAKAPNPHTGKNGKKDQQEKRATEWEVIGRREWSSNPVSAQFCLTEKQHPSWSKKGLEDAMKSLFDIEEH